MNFRFAAAPDLGGSARPWCEQKNQRRFDARVASAAAALYPENSSLYPANLPDGTKTGGCAAPQRAYATVSFSASIRSLTLSRSEMPPRMSERTTTAAYPIAASLCAIELELVEASTTVRAPFGTCRR